MKSFQQFNEDLQARRQQLAQRQKEHLAAFKEKSKAVVDRQREKQDSDQERERLKKEIKQELQTEQHPTMEPNKFNKQIARQSATWKGRQIRQAHGEMEHEAGAELSAKKARIKTIMSR